MAVAVAALVPQIPQAIGQDGETRLGIGQDRLRVELDGGEGELLVLESHHLLFISGTGRNDTGRDGTIRGSSIGRSFV